MTSIDIFKAKTTQMGGFAKPNVFQVILPTFGRTEFGGENLSLLCTAVQMPGRQIMHREQYIGPVRRNYAYGFTTIPINLTFRVMNDYGIRNYFDYWQNLAFNQETKEIGFHNEYTKQVKIRQLKKGVALPIYSTRSVTEAEPLLLEPEQIMHEVTLEDAFPDSMNGLEFGDQIENQPLDMNVSLLYTNWITTKK